MTNGHAAGAPPSSEMNSRRFIRFPKTKDDALSIAGQGAVHRSKTGPLMSALGH
jgi:hypothetical protein